MIAIPNILARGGLYKEGLGEIVEKRERGEEEEKRKRRGEGDVREREEKEIVWEEKKEER